MALLLLARARRPGGGRATSSASRGAALLEALIAAVVVAVGLMLVVGLLTHSAKLTWRAEGQRQAFAALEGVIEGVRAGGLAPSEGAWTRDLPPWVRLPAERDARLELEVTGTEVPNVVELTLTITYRAGWDPQRRRLVTRMWRPPP
jgi:Tfp pilus assembly protein PilV